MTTAAGRKKSLIAIPAPTIDLPVATNTALNKAASQSTSLYQQCSSLRTRLMRVPDFSDFFNMSYSNEPSSSRRSTDIVHQLWDCFALGVPLCYLFNLLPNVTPIDIDVANFDPTNDRTRKRAIALFAMNVKGLDLGSETFTVTDLWNRESNDGFVKVVNIVTALVDQLPEDVFIDIAPSSPPAWSPKDSSDSLPGELLAAGQKDQYPGFQVVTELIHTERKYVQDLEQMQRYATAAAQTNTLDHGTIHLLFPNLNKLVTFQRRFLIKLESIWEQPWNAREWGSAFTESEDDFSVYEPYCANYTNACEIMLTEEQNLSALNDILNVKSELPAFLIKPVQRICKYPLLLESLVKTLKNVPEYSHMDDLAAGVAVTKRITDRVNEEQRRAENIATLKNLEGRVADWKGHHISNFGTLLLDDIFMVTKSEMDREYHVFLFEKIILCCKEYTPVGPNGKRGGKSNSLLKKQGVPAPLSIVSSQAGANKKNTPLLLKGRIFLNNVTSAVPKIVAGQYSLAVYWKGDEDLEYFTLRCRNEEQLRLWENQLNRLIQEVAARRTSESRSMHMRLAHIANSTNPAPPGRQNPHGSERTFSVSSRTASTVSNGSIPPYPGPYSSRNSRFAGSITSEDQSILGGPPGYPASFEGFDPDVEDDYEDYPMMASTPASGRGTPINSRRPSHPDGYSTMRSSGSGSAMAPPISAYPYAPQNGRATPRTSQSGHPRPSLRSQFSSAGLKEEARAASRASGSSPQIPVGAMPTTRSRSASQPSAYVPRQPPPPLPTSGPWEERSHHPIDSKRGSGSSQSTGDNSSDYSPNSSSPITPYGSSDSSLSGMTGVRTHHDKVLTSATQQLEFSVPVKVKVHFHEDIFVIQVPRSTEYEELVERVGRKIRLCGPRRDDGPLRVKYKDEDGDLVSLGSTEDVQMAFESFRPGSQVTLYVQ
ncbi:hypothetical protein BDY19DRAFT_891887 [Irpex rosettiformis]|uniref:Uncharacterized protein n=1 Tax=Irpex rosettiformis TaxID=378272 RepID=A0ACB8U0S9_9APHY|nr:hypothetical protein BDY19DRAFT_891887 [Irpex rosettiformis]